MLLRFLLVSIGGFLGAGFGLLGYIIWAILSIPHNGIHTQSTSFVANIVLLSSLMGALVVGGIIKCDKM